MNIKKLHCSLVALYGIWPGNETGPLLHHRGSEGAIIKDMQHSDA